MKTDIHLKIISLATATLLIATVSGCSKQNWYHGAQSAKTAKCMQEPQSEYTDCNQQTDQSYDEYDRNREELIKENTTTE